MSIFIVAEIGINHNGDMEVCKQLIDEAVDAGCDAVKFQKRDINLVYTQDFLDSPRESMWGTTQREQKLGLEFGLSDYKEIINIVLIKVLSGLHLLGIWIVSYFFSSLIVNIIKWHLQ